MLVLSPCQVFRGFTLKKTLKKSISNVLDKSYAKYMVNRPMLSFILISLNGKEPTIWLLFSKIEFMLFQLLTWKFVFKVVYIIHWILFFFLPRSHKLLEICPFGNRLGLCPKLGTLRNGSSSFPWRSYPTCSWRQLEIRYVWVF